MSTYPYTRPYFVGSRIHADGTATTFVQSLFVAAEGIEKELDPVELDLAGPEFDEWKQRFGATQQTEIKSLKDELATIKKELETTKESLETATANVTKLTGLLDEAKAQISAMDAAAVVAKEQLTATKQSFNESATKIKDLELAATSASKAASEQKSKLEAEITESKRVANERLAKVTELTQQLAEKEASIEGLIDVAKQADEEIATLKAGIELTALKHRQDLLEARQGTTPEKDGVLRASNKQVRKWLTGAGITEEQVASLISSIEDPAQQKAALIDWEYETVFRRDNPIVIAIGAGLGLTEAQLDLAFIEAAKIT